MVKEVEAARRERDDAHKKCTLLEREIASKRALISELEQENSRWEVEFRECECIVEVYVVLVFLFFSFCIAFPWYSFQRKKVERMFV